MHGAAARFQECGDGSQLHWQVGLMLRSVPKGEESRCSVVDENTVGQQVSTD